MTGGRRALLIKYDTFFEDVTRCYIVDCVRGNLSEEFPCSE